MGANEVRNMKPYQRIAEDKAEKVVNSMINGRRERYIEASNYSFHPNRTFDTYNLIK